MTVSNYQMSLLGVEDVVMSMPAIIGAQGMEFQIPLKLDEWETEHLLSSAQTLKSTISQVDLSL